MGRFRIAPPLTISEEEIAEGLAIMDEAFEFCLSQDVEIKNAEAQWAP
jgi:acetylornithine/succinyldiaminopimelate/putrescine aminotransferase